MQQKGLLVVVSGPSGTGKGTVLNALRQRNEKIRYSVSATTRKPRQGEIEGQNYFFKSVEDFKGMIEDDELLEWVQYCDNYYGTPKKYIEDCTRSGLIAILEVEVEGALNIKKRYPECVAIFILPPSFEELKKRIESRGTEMQDAIDKRMSKAKIEMQFVNQYDYIVINDKVENAADCLNSILLAEKLKVSRNIEFLHSMKREG